MKSLLLIVGFALVLAASGKNDKCGYTVTRGPNPSECEKTYRWLAPYDEKQAFPNEQYKAFYTKNKITWREAQSLCEFHCSALRYRSRVWSLEFLLHDLGVNTSTPVWTNADEKGPCYAMPDQYGHVVAVDCNSKQLEVYCYRNKHD
ncbi:hypothetical protein Q1695_010563 [Nippostrongylus brasiliensis]|nr:hypothetical protein Q1695_010563 [Nippostrongylus brasiliensis]